MKRQDRDVGLSRFNTATMEIIDSQISQIEIKLTTVEKNISTMMEIRLIHQRFVEPKIIIKTYLIF